MTARQIARVIEDIAAPVSGVPGDELGFIHGNPDGVVTRLGCAWCVRAASLQHSIDCRLDMLVCHERLWLPPQTSSWYAVSETIFSNRLRRELLDRSGLIVYRTHPNWDALAVQGVPDSAVAALRLPGLHEVAREKFFSVQELGDAMPVGKLKTLVEKGLSYSPCRLFGNPQQRVRRFAFLIGGFGENQFHMPQAAMESGAEAIILGEMSEFIVMACLEMDMPVIETLHSVSEIPAVHA